MHPLMKNVHEDIKIAKESWQEFEKVIRTQFPASEWKDRMLEIVAKYYEILDYKVNPETINAYNFILERQELTKLINAFFEYRNRCRDYMLASMNQPVDVFLKGSDPLVDKIGENLAALVTRRKQHIAEQLDSSSPSNRPLLDLAARYQHLLDLLKELPDIQTFTWRYDKVQGGLVLMNHFSERFQKGHRQMVNANKNWEYENSRKIAKEISFVQLQSQFIFKFFDDLDDESTITSKKQNLLTALKEMDAQETEILAEVEILPKIEDCLRVADEKPFDFAVLSSEKSPPTPPKQSQTPRGAGATPNGGAVSNSAPSLSTSHQTLYQKPNSPQKPTVNKAAKKPCSVM